MSFERTLIPVATVLTETIAYVASPARRVTMVVYGVAPTPRILWFPVVFLMTWSSQSRSPTPLRCSASGSGPPHVRHEPRPGDVLPRTRPGPTQHGASGAREMLRSTRSPGSSGVPRRVPLRARARRVGLLYPTAVGLILIAVSCRSSGSSRPSSRRWSSERGFNRGGGRRRPFPVRPLPARGDPDDRAHPSAGDRDVGVGGRLLLHRAGRRRRAHRPERLGKDHPPATWRGCWYRTRDDRRSRAGRLAPVGEGRVAPSADRPRERRAARRARRPLTQTRACRSRASQAGEPLDTVRSARVGVLAGDAGPRRLRGGRPVEPKILLLDEVHEALDHEFRWRCSAARGDPPPGGIVVAAGHDHPMLERLSGGRC